MCPWCRIQDFIMLEMHQKMQARDMQAPLQHPNAVLALRDALLIGSSDGKLWQACLWCQIWCKMYIHCFDCVLSVSQSALASLAVCSTFHGISCHLTALTVAVHRQVFDYGMQCAGGRCDQHPSGTLYPAFLSRLYRLIVSVQHVLT